MPIWWLCFTFYESGWYEIVFPTHALLNHDIKLGVNGRSEELFRFLKWHVFAHFCIILPIAARADFKLWRARTALWKVKSDWKSMEIVNCRIRNPNHVKILNFCHSFALRARTTRADTYGRKIWKCSKWPGSCSKLFIGDFEHVKILTRAHVRVVTRTGTKIVSMLPYELKFMGIEFG